MKKSLVVLAVVVVVKLGAQAPSDVSPKGGPYDEWRTYGADLASIRKMRNAAARPSSRCSGTGIRRRGKCAPANEIYGAVER